MTREYIVGLYFNERASVLVGEIDGDDMRCFLRPNRPKVVVGKGETAEGCETVETYDLAEVLYAGIKALEGVK
jgi:hypothetical protein